ncbi:unnamed protein product [Effrenium voratum]|uniref:Small ribosomal subunit protein mS29 n=1 Tax=Effrenium voratum TaxID=2562239 RepID=A0AA36MZW0_9DINO|nr:unnamed protein product [Effrenium voratum]
MVAEQLLRDPALFQRAIGSAPSVLELAAEYCGHCLAETQRFTAWEAENVDVLRSHLRSMLCGGVGASEADPGTERLLGEATRARARYVLDWWRIQQATSVEEAVALYRERCASICPEASAGFPAPAAPPAPRQTAPSFEATPRLARGWLLSAAAAVKALAVSLYAWLWPTPCQPSAESLLVVTRRLYEPLIEKTVDTEVKAQNLSGSQRLRRIAQYRRQVRTPSMSDVLQQPQNVWEIVEFGLDSAEYAVQAVAETFTQLQRQRTHPVLVVVDDWNECFPCSEYVSIRYDNTRFNGYIPAYHLSMPRALHRWDGRKYRRGLKLCATSWQRYKRRQYRPELLGVQDYEIRTVRNFTQQEFANYVMYLRLMNVVHKFPPEDLEYFYMLTQGNGWQARRILSTLY